jgi:transposase-like protein
VTLESKSKNAIRYSKEFKRKIAKSYLSGKGSYVSIAKENNLGSSSLVHNCVKWYLSEMKKEGQEELNPLKGLEELSQEAQIELLKKHLKAASLRTEALETMIDIAEEELKIKIRKKSGAKPSKK